LAGSFDGQKNFQSDFVNDDNFTELFDGRSISKIAMGTLGPSYGLTDQLFQYTSLKHALMTGGINHIDTGSNFSDQSSERIVGQVLQTLHQKYEIDRENFFVSSKQGYTAFDAEEDCPRDIEVQEVIARSNGLLTMNDFTQDFDSKDKLQMYSDI
jgi:aryl-alcohol dehydrogenase-like predicted oxidoreductase